MTNAWDASARTIASFVGNGWFSFEIPAGTQGPIVVGLNDFYEGPNVAQVEHAFQVTTGAWRVVENGQDKTSYVSFSGQGVFRIMRYEGFVYYMVGDTPSVHAGVPFELPAEVVYVSPTAFSGEALLTGHIYVPGDSIYNVDVYEVPASVIDVVAEYVTSGGMSTPPSVQDYELLGITGVTEANLAAVNAAVLAAEAITVEEIQAIVDAINALQRIVDYAASDGTTTAPTVADYIAIGVVGVNEDNLEDINALIAGSDPGDVDTAEKIQAIIADRAQDIFTDFADTDGATDAPTVDDYEAIGVVGVTPDNIDAINDIIAGSDPGDVDTPEKIQQIVIDYIISVIVEYADTDGASTPPTVSDYEAIGVVGVTPENIDAINDLIAGSDPGDVDTVEKIQALVDSYRQAIVTFAPMEIQAAQNPEGVYTFGVNASFAPMTVLASEEEYRFGSISFQPMQVEASEFYALFVQLQGAATQFEPMGVTGYGGGYFPSEATVTFSPMQAQASEEEYAEANISFLGLFAFASGYTPLATPYFFGVLPALRGSEWALSDSDVQEIIQVGDEYLKRYGLTALDRVAANFVSRTFYTQTVEQLDLVRAALQTIVSVAVNLQDLLEAESAANAVEVIQLLDQAGILTSVETFRQLAIELVSTATAELTAQANEAVTLTDSLDAELIAQVTQLIDVLEDLEVEAATEQVLTLIVTDVLEMQAEDSVETFGHYLADVTDDVGVWLGFRLGEESFTGWVMNTEGEMPLSEYRGYDFNSFCRIGDHFYGAGDDGLYLLDGDTDAGQPIDAAVRTMMLDFGSAVQKRVRNAYIGYTASGKLLLRVRTVDNGQLNEQWYEAQELQAQAPREQMIRLGRGLRSRYWQFELVNIDGADFELDALEVHPIYLNRRV